MMITKKTTFILALSFIFSISLSAQNIIGKWKTIDDATGKEKSVVEIFKRGDKYYGKIVSIVNPAKRDKTCIKCTDSRKDKPVMGMEIIKDLQQDDDEYEDGTILDPENGKTYKCNVSMEGEEKLKLRGYIGFAALGRNQIWNRIK